MEEREETVEQQEAHLKALRAASADKIATIQWRWKGGMPRRKLIDLFGQDLVDLAIAELV